MSEKTIADIHSAIQAHIDSKEGPDEQLVDFIVGMASLNEKGGWCYAYTTSNMISPHGTTGLINNIAMIVDDDLFPDGE